MEKITPTDDGLVRKIYKFLSGFRLQLLILCILLTLNSMGCGSSNKCSVIDQVHDNFPAPTSNLQVDIFLDATLSMKGFTGTESFSHYQQIIPLLESSVINNLKGRKAFYKFGSRAEPLPEREFLQAQKPVFYTDPDVNTRTLIENVLEDADNGHLTIIVSDLFQDNADVNQLTEKIKSKFIEKNLAVGVLGIKSGFNGQIYDVGSNNYSFTYSTDGEDTYRPFYILAFGSHASIVAYFDALEQSGVKKFPVKERIIFSKYLTEKPASYLGGEIKDKKNANELRGTIVKNEKNLTDFAEFRIRDGKKPATIEMQLPFSRLSNTVDFKGQLAVEVESLVCGPVQQGNSDTAKASRFILSEKVANSIKIDGQLIGSDKIGLKLNINSSELGMNTINAFKVTIRPAQATLPAWIDVWDMTDPEIESWHKNPSEFDGTKTYNLKHFIQSLWITTKTIHDPKVGELFLYVKSD